MDFSSLVQSPATPTTINPPHCNVCGTGANRESICSCFRHGRSPDREDCEEEGERKKPQRDRRNERLAKSLRKTHSSWQRTEEGLLRNVSKCTVAVTFDTFSNSFSHTCMYMWGHIFASACACKVVNHYSPSSNLILSSAVSRIISVSPLFASSASYHDVRPSVRPSVRRRRENKLRTDEERCK